MGEFDDTSIDSTPDVSEPEVDTSIDDSVDFSDDSFSEEDMEDVNAEIQEAYDEYDLAREETAEETEPEESDTTTSTDSWPEDAGVGEPSNEYSMSSNEYNEEPEEENDVYNEWSEDDGGAAANEQARKELEEFSRLQKEQEEQAEAERAEQAEVERVEQKETERAEQEDYDKQYAEMSDRYRDLDNQYQNIKNDIEMSRTPEEQEYWQKRGDDVWNERDKLGAEMDALNNKRNNKMYYFKKLQLWDYFTKIQMR